MFPKSCCSLLLAGMIVVCAAILSPAPASAVVYTVFTHEGVDGVRGFINAPFYQVTRHAMELQSGGGTNPYPVSNPVLPDPEKQLRFPVRTIQGSGEFFLKVHPYLAVNPRGIVEGVAVLQVYRRFIVLGDEGLEFVEELFLEERIRVKGRARFQFQLNANVDGLVAWRDPVLNSRVDVRQSWNHRITAQGRGRDDRGRDPLLADLFAILLEPEDILELEEMDIAPYDSRFRMNLSTTNQVNYFVDTAAEAQRPESARRNGRRNFQPTGPVDVVFDGRRLRRSHGGIDVREGELSDVAMFYDAQNFEPNRILGPNNRLRASTNAGVVSEMLGESSLPEVFLGGRGRLEVTAARDRTDRRTPGRYTVRGNNRIERGTRYRAFETGYVFDLTDTIIDLYEGIHATDAGTKPANFLDFRDLDRELRQHRFSSPQLNDRAIWRYSGRQHLPLPPG